MHARAHIAPVVEPFGHIPSDTHATMRSVGNGGHYGIRYISAGNTVDCATGGEVIDEAHVFDIPCFHRAIGKIQRAAHILTGQLLPYVEVTCRRTHHANAFAGDVVVALRDHDIQCLDHRVILIGIELTVGQVNRHAMSDLDFLTLPSTFTEPVPVAST